MRGSSERGLSDTSEETLPAIQHKTWIGVPPGRVYETLTTAAGWDAWFTQGTELDARPGGRIRLRWRDFGGERTTAEDGDTVTAAEPDRCFAFRWSPRDLPTEVRFRLAPRGDGTLVELTDRGYPRSEEGIATMMWCACGWGEALTLLKFYLERGATYGAAPP